jgi:hypothetical protein
MFWSVNEELTDISLDKGSLKETFVRGQQDIYKLEKRVNNKLCKCLHLGVAHQFVDVISVA